MVAVGSGDFAYEVVDSWGSLPEGFQWGQIGSVNVDADDRVYLFTRTDHPLMVFERDGRFVRSFGENGVVKDAHGLCLAPDGTIFLVDRAAHVVMKFTKDGQKLFELGRRDQPSNTGYTQENRTVLRSAGPFNYPTDVAFSTDGEFYVSDGYRNAAVHKFAPDGRLLFSWGRPGNGPGQFNLVHSVWETKGRVYVADRENNRIQIFTPVGQYLDMWTDFVQPSDIYVDENDIMYVAELAGRVTLLTLDGTIITRIGDLNHRVPEAGKFVGPHGIWADRHGDFYVSEVLQGQRIQKFIKK